MTRPHFGHWLALYLAGVPGCTTDVRVADDIGDPAAAPSGSTGSSDDDGAAFQTTTDGSQSSTGVAETGQDDADGDSDGGPKLDVANDDGGDRPPPIGCIGGNDIVWVLVLDEDDNRRPELYQFDPAAPAFEWVADMECLPLKNVGDNPLSMAVGRDGRALLALETFQGVSAGQYLYAFDLFADDPCLTLEIDAWEPPAQGNSLTYAALDPEAPQNETLFTHNVITRTFGAVRFDLPIVAVDFIGNSPQAYMTLTGTADGRIFAIAGSDSWAEGELIRIDPDTATQAEVLLTTPSGAHPAFYGGDILLFEVNQQPPGWSPRVLRYDADDDDGSGDNELTEIFGEDDSPPNLWIRGVASPTCVPLTPEG